MIKRSHLPRIDVFRWDDELRTEVAVYVNGVRVPALVSYSVTEPADGIKTVSVTVGAEQLNFHDHKPDDAAPLEPYDWEPEGRPETKALRHVPGEGFVVEGEQNG